MGKVLSQWLGRGFVATDLPFPERKGTRVNGEEKEVAICDEIVEKDKTVYVIVDTDGGVTVTGTKPTDTAIKKIGTAEDAGGDESGGGT